MPIGDKRAIRFESCIEPLRSDTRFNPGCYLVIELGFRRSEELSSVIEDPVTDATGGETSAHPAPFVNDDHIAARIDKSTRSGQPRQTSTDDENLKIRQRLALSPRQVLRIRSDRFGPCHRVRSSRSDSWRDTAGDNPRHRKTGRPRRSP
jgi:hypothetical protein